MFSLRYIDTCAVDYLTNRHNREGELLLGVDVDASSTNATVCAGLLEAWRTSDVRQGCTNDDSFSAATVDVFEGQESTAPWFDPNEQMPDDCEGEVRAWFVLRWSDEPAAPQFAYGFRNYVCEGDSIETTCGGFRFVATVYRDDSNDKPDERQDGFWPSLNPQDAGYIGAKSLRTLARHTARAQSVMDAWKRDEWFYCGVAVQAFVGDVEVTGEFDRTIWGIECNYPQHDKRREPNAYLTQVAGELISECHEAAKVRAAELAQAFAAIAAAGAEQPRDGFDVMSEMVAIRAAVVQ
jgi:hypothetical protein